LVADISNQNVAILNYKIPNTLFVIWDYCIKKNNIDAAIIKLMILQKFEFTSIFITSIHLYKKHKVNYITIYANLNNKKLTLV